MIHHLSEHPTTMFFDSVFPVILVLQALVLHIACMLMTTFCIAGQQIRGFKAATVMFLLFRGLYYCLMGNAQFLAIKMLYLAIGYLKEFSFFDLQDMVFPY